MHSQGGNQENFFFPSNSRIGGNPFMLIGTQAPEPAGKGQDINGIERKISILDNWMQTNQLLAFQIGLQLLRNIPI